MSVIPMRPLTKREPGPYAADRSCETCGARLSTYNPSPSCAPCSGGDWIPPDLNEFEKRRLQREYRESAA